MNKRKLKYFRARAHTHTREREREKFKNVFGPVLPIIPYFILYRFG